MTRPERQLRGLAHVAVTKPSRMGIAHVPLKERVRLMIAAAYEIGYLRGKLGKRQ